jgi:hypothetical protein
MVGTPFTLFVVPMFYTLISPEKHSHTHSGLEESHA